MLVHWTQPVLAFVAALIVLCSLAFFWRRGVPAGLLVLAAAFFALAGAGPAVGGVPQEPRHALVLDVSDSMTPRLEAARTLAETAPELPAGQGWLKRQLSDSLRGWGAPTGGQTAYQALSALGAEPAFVGECVLITDGRGSLDDLAAAIEPARSILLRAPAAERPDAAVVDLRVPGNLPAGAAAVMQAEITCDRESDARWRVFIEGQEAASGGERLQPGVRVPIAHVFRAPESGVLRLSVSVEVAGDREGRNDKAGILVRALGKRVLWYVQPEGVAEGNDALLALLRADAANEVRVRRALPRVSDLAGIAALVINDAPPGADAPQMQGIAQWVRAGGRILMAGVGGAFGPGGWRGTPIEDVMPVKFRPDDDPARRWLLLLDCSDSMNAAVGGEKRLEVLKQGARRVLEKLGDRDLACVAGFNREVLGTLEFTADRRRLLSRLQELQAGGATNIRGSLEAALRAFSPVEGEARVFLVTDGQEGEPGDMAAYSELARLAHARGIKIDVVLTEPAPRDWTGWLKEGPASVTVTAVGERGFGELIEKLEAAATAADKALIERGPLSVAGVAARVPALARTAPRAELRQEDALLSANKESRAWPLLVTRQLLGRSVALTCETWGGALWSDAVFIAAVNRAMDFLLAGAARTHLKLERGNQLVWIGAAAAPERDLELADGTPLRLIKPGRWRLEAPPQAEEIVIHHLGRPLERISLPLLPPPELRLTGDDEDFFVLAQTRGFRVLRSLAAWEPRAGRAAPGEGWNLAWLCALVGAGFVLAGYSLRRRA